MLRVSERNDSWNAAYKAEDLTNIITLCDDVIGSHHKLAGDYRDLWNWTGTDCATETLSEWLLVAQFNKDAAADGRFGNRIYSNFNPQFSMVCSVTGYSVDSGLDLIFNVADQQNITICVLTK